MRHKNEYQVSCKEGLNEYSVIPGGIGDIASGTVRLVYDTHTVELPYDTKGGPDGLMTVLDASLGDWVHGTKDGNYGSVLVTEKVLKDGKNHFSGNLKAKAVMGELTVKEV